MTVRIIEGDCRDVLPTLSEGCVHSIVTDPPYHLTNVGGGPAKGNETPHSRAQAGAASRGFMRQTWDGGDVAFDPATWAECLRVLKPGGYLLAFGHARTYHRLVCAVEDAGFEVRDTIARFYTGNEDRDAFLESLSPSQSEAFLRAFGRPSTIEWVYGSGFPKSWNLCRCKSSIDGGTSDEHGWKLCATCGAPYELGSALKPGHEPILVARKALAGTLAANVKAHGTGALNIGGCRVAVDREDCGSGSGRVPARHDKAAPRVSGGAGKPHEQGRWPANVIHDGSGEVVSAFPDVPGRRADATPDTAARNTQEASAHSPNRGAVGFSMRPGARRTDSGSAARFFYCPKASPSDRNVGVASGGRPGAAYNDHPTVKPTELMRYVVRLVTPPGGITLDPFCGSGSTGRAADIEGMDAILIDIDPDNVAIARRRIGGDAPLLAQVIA